VKLLLKLIVIQLPAAGKVTVELKTELIFDVAIQLVEVLKDEVEVFPK
jgi:hypothetical protein